MSEINKVGSIPEFTPNETPQGVADAEVKQPETPEIPAVPIETDTPTPPVEKPLQGPEPLKVEPTIPQDPTQTVQALNGLQQERVKLLKEISELRGQKREIKQEQLEKVQERIDELKDLHPDDVQVIDRVLRAKGYVSQKEVQKMFYEAVKDEELTRFLDKYPEYKPENDPGDTNWQALQREIGYYRLPENPRQVADILERAHRSVFRVPTDLGIPTKKRQVEIASVGGGGAQRSSTQNRFDADKRAMLARGGFSEDEIQKMESRSRS